MAKAKKSSAKVKKSKDSESKVFLKSKKSTKQQRYVKSPLVKWLSYTLYTLSAFCILLSIYNLYFSNKILPGVYLNDQNYSGLTREQAIKQVNKNLPSAKYITVQIEDQESYQILFENIALQYDARETVNSLFSAGRTSVLSHLSHVLGVFRPVYTGQYNYVYDKDLLNVELATISAKSFPANQNAYFYIENGELKIKDADFGKNIELKKLENDITKGLSVGATEFTATTYDFKPTVVASDLSSLKDQVSKYLSYNFAFLHDENTYTPNADELLTFITVTKENDTVKVVANNQNIKAFIVNLSDKINIEPKALVFEVSGDSIKFEPPITGIEINTEESAQTAQSHIESFFTEDKKGNLISLSSAKTKPDTNSNQYGITELLAEGESWFRGSISSRVSNIKTASTKIQGTLVAPGEVFSFNKAVGPIDKANGFNDAYVISKGRTVLGNGGGVCQVSTTVYRAALNSGLPIVERNAHAYRVGYYEQEFPVGLDATIYQPGVDLKFKNDTKHHILVYSEFDAANSYMSVKIYGTGDGRTVQISEVKKLSEIAPPDAIYEDTEELPKGVVEQVEYPAWGGAVEYTRVVKDANGNEMYNDTFKSYYTPWPAVFKRGV
jgi:vancomycin resistance protein YoaR